MAVYAFQHLWFKIWENLKTKVQCSSTTKLIQETIMNRKITQYFFVETNYFYFIYFTDSKFYMLNYAIHTNIMQVIFPRLLLSVG